jgi:putative phosphoribosyl transferase
VPWQRELAMGAIAPYGTRVLNERVVRHVGVTREQIDDAASREEAELNRQLDTYRHDRPPLEIAGRAVVIVDDGLATGSSALAAAYAVRSQQPRRLILAAPVGAPDTVGTLAELDGIDAVVCPLAPVGFIAVGQYYRHFGQVSDDEVVAALASRS